LTDDGSVSNAAQFNYGTPAHWRQILSCVLSGSNQLHAARRAPMHRGRFSSRFRLGF